MKHLLMCLYGILAILCISSCKKDSDPDPSNDNVPQDTLLTKVIIWDSVNLGADAYTREFVFDDQKRVKTIIRYKSDTNGVQLPGAKTDTSLQCFYNGAERNAYRTIGWTLFVWSDKADILHYYNNSNQIIKDSIKYSSTSYQTRTYIYLPDKLITYDISVTGIFPIGYRRDTFQVINNNITYGKFSIPPGVGWDIFEMSYDNKINPFTKLNIAPLKIIEGGQTFDKGTYLSPGYCKNNMTQRVSKNSDPNKKSTATDNFQYTYNESNLPAYCKITSTYYTTFAGRVKYIYTH